MLLERVDRRLAMSGRECSGGHQAFVDGERLGVDRVHLGGQSEFDEARVVVRAPDCGTEPAVELGFARVGTGPTGRCRRRSPGHHLVLFGELPLRADGECHTEAEDRRDGDHEENGDDHPDPPRDTMIATTIAITRTVAAMAAAAIFTLLYGRAPWTSPVTPLM